MSKNSLGFSVRNRIHSFRYAFKGVAIMFYEEPNFRIHIIAASVTVAFGIIYEISAVEWMMISVVIGLVLVSEIFNAAVERIADFDLMVYQFQGFVTAAGADGSPAERMGRMCQHIAGRGIVVDDQYMHGLRQCGGIDAAYAFTFGCQGFCVARKVEEEMKMTALAQCAFDF